MYDEEFSAFVVAESPRLLAVARLLCRDADAAKDLVQGALMRCYARWDRLTETGIDPYAYVRRAVVNAHVSWLRRPFREHPTDRFDDASQAAADPDERLVLERALATLTPRERAVIVLRFFEDLTEAQTADTLGIRVGTVKSATHRALRRLQVQPDVVDLAADRGIGATAMHYRKGPAHEHR